MAGSLKAGLAAAADADGVVVLLGDMPGVTAGLVDAMIGAFEQAPSSLAVIPVRKGRRGNPVLLARALFPRLQTLSGDTGARRLLAEAEGVVELPVDDDAILADVDAPADLAAFTRK
jgi:molybdenum cofactor cytidylyltransferase